MVTEQVSEVPVHPPAQPTKGTPTPGAAVRVTTVPAANEVPVGFVVTLPFPLSLTTSLKVADGGGGGGGATTPVKAAVTAALAFIVSVQVRDVPAQAPVQPVNVCPAEGVAVSVTTLPLRKVVPDGSVVTDPSPVVVKVNLNGVRNVAVVAVPLFTVVVQVKLVPAAAQAPVQPEKIPLPFLAVRVTGAPASVVIEHTPGQRITLLDDDTWPSPETVTVIEGTPTLAAAFCAPMKLPTSVAAGTLQVTSAQMAR